MLGLYCARPPVLCAGPPPRGAVLILREVLGYHATEVADMLDATVESVTSALKRARATLQPRLPPEGEHQPPPAPDSPAEQALVAKFVHACVGTHVTCRWPIALTSAFSVTCRAGILTNVSESSDRFRRPDGVLGVDKRMVSGLHGQFPAGVNRGS
jgi:hypothetical protein